jgi:hypothetical protein
VFRESREVQGEKGGGRFEAVRYLWVERRADNVPQVANIAKSFGLPKSTATGFVSFYMDAKSVREYTLNVGRKKGMSF